MPLYALVNALRQRATRTGPRRAVCPWCDQPMMAKTGDVVIWHWAHLAETPGCPSAGETRWHLEWKDLGPDGSQERTVGNRRADVLAPGGFAVEFQRSALTADEVTDREADWQHQLVWIFDAGDAYYEERLTWYTPRDRSPGDAYCNLRWAHAPERVRAAQCRSFLDIGDGSLIMVGRWFDDSWPLQGYGWQVSQDWVVAHVLHGQAIPPVPSFARSVPLRGVSARAAGLVARTGLRPLLFYETGRGHGLCPACGGEHGSCDFAAGSLYCVTDGCPNPHHRAAPVETPGLP